MGIRPGKQVKIGHDKRPAPLINTDQPLYNIRTGRQLTDEGGTALVSAEDQYLLSEASSDKASPVTFNTDPPGAKIKKIKISGTEFSVTTPTLINFAVGTIVSKYSFVTANGNTYAVVSEGGAQTITGSAPSHVIGEATIGSITYGFLKTGTNTISVVQSPDGDFKTEISGGDNLLLPTGVNAGQKFYEERIVETVFNEHIALLRTGPSSENNLFSLLEKKIVTVLSSNWKIEEQFAEFSEVSTSILGVPKAEEQLSLFADVSSYGQDDSRFTFYRDDGGTNQPAAWRDRKSELYGNHYRSRLREEKEESAIVLEAFPTPYTYPYGPRFNVDGLYSEIKYGYWNNFLKLGTVLYTYFSDPANYGSNPNFASKFLPFTGTLEYNQTDFNEYFTNDLDFTDSYSNEREFFNQIDIWTETWRDINLGNVSRPTGGILDAEWINGLGAVQLVLPVNAFPTQTAPGYSTAFGSYMFMQSRKAFRYQPGRISGYTFGVRTSNDATDSNTITEWGIGNDTDQLVFQVKGSTFNIVRRSVVPLSDSVLAMNKLAPSDQIVVNPRNPQRSDDPDKEPLDLYEITIPTDNWNGDPLDGTGDSRYNAILNKVTMYKVEFGWYGAIGVQFYAFIPVDNDEARWVKLHRLTIENQLDRPCMGDPFYRFIFSLQIKNNISLRSPQYIYKYGTSCYIDGGDEGTVEVFSGSADEKAVSPTKDTTLVGLYPKDKILNSTGVEIVNKKTIIPKQFSISADDLTQVQLVKCSGCPGFAQNYSPNLQWPLNGPERVFNFLDVGGGSYSRSIVELALLNKTVDGVVSSGSTEITLDDVNNLRVGDHIKEGLYFQADTVVTDITSNTLTIDPATNAEIPNDTSIEIQPLFNEGDYFAKFIRAGFFNCYVGELQNELAGGYTQTTLDGWSSERGDQPFDEPYFKYSETSDASRNMPTEWGSGGSNTHPNTNWTARLSRYGNVVPSSIPISGRKNEFLWLNPAVRDSNSLLAEYKIGVTDLIPQTDSAPGSIVSDLTGFKKRDDTIVTELPEENRLEVEWHPEGVSKDRSGFENGEYFFGRISPFTRDYRIKQPIGTNSGRCSYITLTVQDPRSVSVQQSLGSDLGLSTDEQNNDPEYDPTAYYLRPAAGGIFNFGFEPKGGEVAYNPVQEEVVPNSGTGIFFDSMLRTYVDTSGSSNVTYEYIKLTDAVVAQSTTFVSITTWFTPVEMRSFRILQQKAFNFKPFPLYFYVDGRDNARLNNIVITEQTEVKSTYNPRWYTPQNSAGNTTATVDAGTVEVGPIGNTTITTGDITLPPANYSEASRLSSASIDIQNLNQLRPYTVIDTFYVSGQTKQVDLSNIFDFDKELITPDLLNTEAYFFVGRSKSGSATNVQSTVTFIEQQ